MTLRLQTFLSGLFALIAAALLALAPAQAKPASGGYQLFEPVALADSQAIQLAALGNFDYHAKIAPECCNATNTGPRFITDSAGNSIDLNFTKGLTETNVTVTGSRGGVQYPLQGQAPNSYANLGNGHAVVYGPDGRALYDVSGARIKVVEWNQSPNGQWFPKKGSDTKAFEGNVPQSVLDDLGLN